jgi:hypothetical protein
MPKKFFYWREIGYEIKRVADDYIVIIVEGCGEDVEFKKIPRSDLSDRDDGSYNYIGRVAAPYQFEMIAQ